MHINREKGLFALPDFVLWNITFQEMRFYVARITPTSTLLEI